MAKTRGNLTPANIKSTTGDISVDCMFNPEWYTVTKTNEYDQGAQLVKPPKPEFKRFGRSTLTLSQLIFDTYETGDDLTSITNKLWDFMRPVDSNDPKSSPPEVKFKWSSFEFTAVITNMTVKYTLFDKDGKPVRAEVSMTFIQSEDPTRYPHQNPTSGGGPIQELHRVVSGDRLDLIATEAYGDATKWRHIAEYNKIRNPRDLRPGQLITIPPL
ncbi:MAG: LysM peptidoglycan-binding domain-containing protein [Ardenticatenaceae bacterium]|nr:LysM peptidoglycan-binding domain-containing protein [Anaerolineales bacterium]MCB8920859.1 LysM peptidoglycan-binding domain-containing protein [Ardenticatenaceae bacterium]MCB8991627.1 LysM peptidoglycan-binding domain-containing protein [Ardenticatenaceae bacterium]